MSYALTNLALVLATMTAHHPGRRDAGDCSPYAALFAAGLWALNFHGIGMALTWISGRTSLLASLFAILAGLADHDWTSVDGRRADAGNASQQRGADRVADRCWRCGSCSIDARSGSTWTDSAGHALTQAWPSFLALVAYAGLRLNTLAFTPWDAPEVYRLTIDPRIIVRNVFEYADRSSTFTVAVLLLGWVIFSRRRLALTADESRAVKKGLVWLGAGVRRHGAGPDAIGSRMRAYPSMGGALAGAAVATALWRHIPESRRRAASVALLLLPLLLLPIYRARNAPSREDAATVVTRS